MKTLTLRTSAAFRSVSVAIAASLLLVGVFAGNAQAAGTPVGTVIENTASINYDLAGTPLSLQSNTTTLTVAERINVTTTLLSPQTLVSANDAGVALLFSVTNTGNGNEAFQLLIESIIAGDDFDPVPSVPAIYFDTDNSGDFNVGDVAYVPGSNDPLLAADESVNVFIVNDIPAGVANGEIGQSQLTAQSVTGTGAPGTVFANQGDGGVNAVIGSTGGEDSDIGEYLVSDVLLSLVKSQVVVDPNGGAEPIPGATLTYTISAEVQSAGVATGSVISDDIPTFTTYAPGSITLNGLALSDAIDADAGEFDNGGTPRVVIRLGDLTQADGIQTIVFSVTID